MCERLTIVTTPHCENQWGVFVYEGKKALPGTISDKMVFSIKRFLPPSVLLTPSMLPSLPNLEFGCGLCNLIYADVMID
jgi:hypothetical protein